jgi:hypothetical protein
MKRIEGYVVMYVASDKTYTAVFPTKKNAKGFRDAILNDVEKVTMSEEPLLLTNNSNVKFYCK